MNPLVSVIIPIYNVAPYLKECLDSVFSQTYKHLEIIMINDGSTDESEQIAKEYLGDVRASLITQENRGLSATRNVGMHQACGELIIFIDSDDYLDLGYIQEMVEIFTQHSVDFVCNEHIVRFEQLPKQPLQKTQGFQILIPQADNIGFGGAVWRFMFAKSFLDACGVEFLEGKIYEDEGFLYMVAPLAERFVKYFGKPYYYRQRTSSIMQKHKNFRSYDLLDVFEAIYLFYEERGLLDRFNPPDYFLWNSGMGYSNEAEYLYRAKKLACRLNLASSPHFCKFSERMQEFLCKDTVSYQKWIKRRIWIIRCINLGRRILGAAKRRLKI
ncbi:glycosyltransferase family 2 protein [Helicobacter pametensis]|uniref:glycosyltransferase family 2 protein n=1 Tax=Helicobacter pametensis TaxID=95149 RepID=UPI000484E77C|nr:glycosyltransferase family A protein [Helicobacter pametensis]